MRGFRLLSSGTWLWLLCLIAACSTKTEFQELDQSQALDRLKSLVSTLDPQVRLLKQGVHPGSGAEYWIFTSPNEVKLPKFLGLEGPSACPADSVFGFAISLGVDSTSIEPPAASSQPLPGQSVPGQSVPGQSVPGQSVPGQSVSGTPQSDTSHPVPGVLRGSMWQWSSDQCSIRLRAVPLKTGNLNIVERLVEL